MTATEEPRPLIQLDPRQPRHGLVGWLTSIDHKRIGLLTLGTATALLIVIGALALTIRTQLARPQLHVLDNDTYNQFFTMHGSGMIYLVMTPYAIGLGLYLVPLQIGAPNVAPPNHSGRVLALRGGRGHHAVRVRHLDRRRRPGLVLLPAAAVTITTEAPGAAVGAGTSFIAHVALLLGAVLFWAPVVGRRRRLPDAGRAAYLFIAGPVLDLAGVWLVAQGESAGGLAMIVGMLPIGIAALALTWQWIIREERQAGATATSHGRQAATTAAKSSQGFPMKSRGR